MCIFGKTYIFKNIAKLNKIALLKIIAKILIIQSFKLLSGHLTSHFYCTSKRQKKLNFQSIFITLYGKQIKPAA